MSPSLTNGDSQEGGVCKIGKRWILFQRRVWKGGVPMLDSCFHSGNGFRLLIVAGVLVTRRVLRVQGLSLNLTATQ